MNNRKNIDFLFGSLKLSHGPLSNNTQNKNNDLCVKYIELSETVKPAISIKHSKYDYVVETIHGCCILYINNFNEPNCWIDYYYYIINTIKTVIKEINSIENKLKINIIFNFAAFFINEYNFNNTNKTIITYINEEHTLVDTESNDNKNIYYTKIINHNKNEKDFFKSIVKNIDYLNISNIIFDYSCVNQMNFKISMEFKKIYIKLVLIHPLLYSYYNSIENRNIHCLTTFLYPFATKKRIDFLNMIQKNNINHININTCKNANDFIKLYRNTKILINIRQTWDFFTTEELRILPALMSGVIVICEDGPLREYIPYQEYIIWTTNDNLIQTIRYVEQNYIELHTKFFSGNRLSNLFEIMLESNKHELYNKFVNYIDS